MADHVEHPGWDQRVRQFPAISYNEVYARKLEQDVHALRAKLALLDAELAKAHTKVPPTEIIASPAAADHDPAEGVGQRLRWLRRTLELSQKRLGALVGVSGSTVSGWERGKRRPTDRALRRLSDRMRESAAVHAWLLTGVQAPRQFALVADEPRTPPPTNSDRYTEFLARIAELVRTGESMAPQEVLEWVHTIRGK